MANKKIKHIIAKLVGSSTEETMDVYDVDAVHTADVINNLTSNTEAAKKKPLSAYQGYVLNNNLNNVDSRTLNGTSDAFTTNWNLNDITTPGVYRFTKSPSDAPSWLNNTFGSVIVTKNFNYVVQVLVYGQISGVAIRFCNDNYPNAWYDFPLQKKS